MKTIPRKWYLIFLSMFNRNKHIEDDTRKIVVIKEQLDGKVIIEIYDSNKGLICINAANNITDAISVLYLLFGSEQIIQEAV